RPRGRVRIGCGGLRLEPRERLIALDPVLMVLDAQDAAAPGEPPRRPGPRHPGPVLALGEHDAVRIDGRIGRTTVEDRVQETVEGVLVGDNRWRERDLLIRGAEVAAQLE